MSWFSTRVNGSTQCICLHVVNDRVEEILQVCKHTAASPMQFEWEFNSNLYLNVNARELDMSSAKSSQAACKCQPAQNAIIQLRNVQKTVQPLAGYGGRYLFKFVSNCCVVYSATRRPHCRRHRGCSDPFLHQLHCQSMTSSLYNCTLGFKGIDFHVWIQKPVQFAVALAFRASILSSATNKVHV